MSLSPVSDTSVQEVSAQTPLTLDALQSHVLSYLVGCVKRESLLCREDLQDLCSEVVTAVWQRLEGIDHPLRYARRSARHAVLKLLRAKRRRRQVHQEWHDTRSGYCGDYGGDYGVDYYGMAAHFDTAAEAARGVPPRRAFVQRQLKDQDGRTRLILHLRYEAGYDWKVIADLVGGTPASVRMRERRFCLRTREAWEAAGSARPLS